MPVGTGPDLNCNFRWKSKIFVNPHVPNAGWMWQACFRRRGRDVLFLTFPVEGYLLQKGGLSSNELWLVNTFLWCSSAGSSLLSYGTKCIFLALDCFLLPTKMCLRATRIGSSPLPKTYVCWRGQHIICGPDNETQSVFVFHVSLSLHHSMPSHLIRQPL